MDCLRTVIRGACSLGVLVSRDSDAPCTYFQYFEKLKLMKIPVFTRCVTFAAAMSIVFYSNGCSGKISPGADLEHAALVTFSQFKEEIESEPGFLWRGSDKKYHFKDEPGGDAGFLWLGSDKNYHYFQAKKGFYRLSSKFQMPFFQRRIDSEVAREIPPGNTFTHAKISGDTIVYDGESLAKSITEAKK